MRQEIHKTDAFALLATIPDNSADLIFTDPPYWTLNKHRKGGGNPRLGGSHILENQTGWFETISPEQLAVLMQECFRILKPERHCFIMSDGQTLREVLINATNRWKYFKPIVWDKVNQGMGYHLRCRHEFIVMLDKGKNRKPKDLGLPDIIKIPMIRGGYPTEKPVALPRLFIEQYANPGEMIIDPFCGAGSTLKAARELGCQFIGSDISAEAIELSTNAVASTLLPFS